MLSDSFSASSILPAKISWRISSRWAVCLRDCVVVRTAAPEGAFVDLQAFIFRAAKHHRADAAVTERQSFGPFGGGFVVGELESGVGW